MASRFPRFYELEEFLRTTDLIRIVADALEASGGDRRLIEALAGGHKSAEPSN